MMTSPSWTFHPDPSRSWLVGRRTRGRASSSPPAPKPSGLDYHQKPSLGAEEALAVKPATGSSSRETTLSPLGGEIPPWTKRISTVTSQEAQRVRTQRE